MPTATVRDARAAEAFVDLLIGWESLGVDANGEEVQRRINPLAHAHLKAALGADLPAAINSHNLRKGALEPLANYLISIGQTILTASAPKPDSHP